MRISNYQKKLKIASIVPIALGLFMLTAVIVRADTAPTVNSVIKNNLNATTTSAVIGSVVHDFAMVASSTDSAASSTPTGTVDFNLFSNTTCSGTSTVQSGVSLVNGVAQSATTVVPNTGLSYMVHYNGQANTYVAVNGPCEPLVAISASTSISTTLSTSTVAASSTVYDTAVLNNVTTNATGTVAYTVFADNTCSTSSVSAGVVSVTNAVVPNSSLILFPAPGTFYWQAIYSGDANNTAATSTCQDEILTVVSATSTPTTTPGQGSISGTVYNDLNRSASLNSGEPLLSGWTINLYAGAGWWGPSHNAPIKTVVSDVNGFYSFSNLADGTYSVEEINQPSLNQFTGDYKSIVIVNGSVITGKDFGNVAGNPNSKGDKGDKDDDKDNNGKGHKDDKGDKESKGKDNNPGNHYGWTIGKGNPHGK